jgi:stage II sporulation protein D
MKKTLILLALFLGFMRCSYAGIELDIRIYSGSNITQLSLTPIIGKYVLYDSDKIKAEVLKTEDLHVSVQDDSVMVLKNGIPLGKFGTLTITGAGLINAFKIKPLFPSLKEREFDDDLEISVVNGNLQIINVVDLEHYVAGVVESEGGGSVKETEFYEVQAICCRTYALNNAKKHAKEGYHLCDATHCQQYLGRCHNAEIQQAVYQTAGDVIVDKDQRMISAAFHANSGGETANSEDVWKIAAPYLRSVTDTFSLKMPGASWEKSMPAEEWLKYLSSRFNYNITDPAKKEAVLNFTQEHRKVYLTDSIRLTTIRNDLGLKSAYFTIKHRGEDVVFYGKGYGHGVGLSQQGAIRMAQLGYTYRDIIKYYFKGTDIMSYEMILVRNF